MIRHDAQERGDQELRAWSCPHKKGWGEWLTADFVALHDGLVTSELLAQVLVWSGTEHRSAC